MPKPIVTRSRFRKDLKEFSIQNEKSIVYCENIERPYGLAVFNVLDVAIEGFKACYGIDLAKIYEHRQLETYFMQARCLRLFAHPNRFPIIHYFVEDGEDLMPPSQGGPHHVYGLCHELAHIVIFFKRSAFTQGIASYFGSMLLPYIHKRLGDEAWPIPYNYLDTEGPDRLKQHAQRAKPATGDAAAKILLAVEKRHGKRKIGEVVNRTLKEGRINYLGSFRQFYVSDFKRYLVRVTGDKYIYQLFTRNGF